MTYHVEAYNTATASTNRIHDDEIARTYGFRGGLVPGVDVYAYLTHVPVARWGPRRWLADGSMSVRFAKPVYDGDRVAISSSDDHGDLELQLADPAGDICATARAGVGATRQSTAALANAELPAVRPPASAEALRPGTVLGSLHEVFDATLHTSYLADVREQLPLYAEEGLAHPGWLLRFANSILSRNVQLGPWIHASSDIDFLGVVEDGDALDVRAVVLDEYERKGHRFVVLDVDLSSVGRAVQRITHTAIHTPRRAAL